jgi:hypothetical protein
MNLEVTGKNATGLTISDRAATGGVVTPGVVSDEAGECVVARKMASGQFFFADTTLPP